MVAQVPIVVTMIELMSCSCSCYSAKIRPVSGDGTQSRRELVDVARMGFEEKAESGGQSSVVPHIETGSLV